MATVTLETLKAQVLARAQIESDDPAAELLVENINEAIRFVREILRRHRQAGFLVNSTPSTFTTTSGVQTVDLPTSMEGLAGVEVQIDGDWLPMDEFDFADRHRGGQSATWYVTEDGRVSARWCLVGDKLFFQDPPDAGYSGRFWYIPLFTDLASDDETVNLYDHNHVVVAYAAATCLDDDQLGADHLWAKVAAWEKKIERTASRRNRGSYGRVRDVTGATSNLGVRPRGPIP